VSGPPIRLAALAAELGLPVEGDGGVELRGAAALETAGPEELAFAGSARHAAALAACRAGAVIAPPGLDTGGRPTLRSERPRLAFARALRRLAPAAPRPRGVHPSAHVDAAAAVDPAAFVGPGCALAAGARVGPGSVLHANVTLYRGVRVGADCVLHAGCVLREDTWLGDRVVLQPGVVLGSDGFGYERDEAGRFEAVPQIGRVVVEDDVEIGAHTCVDRASLGETRIARGSKLDNLVQVGHNCRVGPDALVVAQAGLGGSSQVESGAILLARAGLVDHVRVGAGAVVGAGSGVTGDVAAGARVLGAPHAELAEARRIFAAWRRLPGLFARLRALERRAGLRGPRGDGA
jgi:UDP-3-O-[3-hydroxymyristoyl] glucosamine N-acyltransferase